MRTFRDWATRPINFGEPWFKWNGIGAVLAIIITAVTVSTLLLILSYWLGWPRVWWLDLGRFFCGYAAGIAVGGKLFGFNPPQN